MVSICHVHGDQVEDGLIEVEYATQVFLERALLEEVTDSVFPTQVVPQLGLLTSTATVKILGIPQKTTSQALCDAMLHYGAIQNVHLTPTLSGAGLVGYVVFHTTLSGKAALEAGYSFLGKERIQVVHPAITKEIESWGHVSRLLVHLISYIVTLFIGITHLLLHATSVVNMVTSRQCVLPDS